MGPVEVAPSVAEAAEALGSAMAARFVEKGLVPHTREASIAAGKETWWEYPAGKDYKPSWYYIAPVLILLITAVFFLILVKGWPTL